MKHCTDVDIVPTEPPSNRPFPKVDARIRHIFPAANDEPPVEHATSGTTLATPDSNKNSDAVPLSDSAANDRKGGLPNYSVLVRKEILDLTRLFFGAHEVGVYFGVTIEVLLNELIVDGKGNDKYVNAVYPEAIELADSYEKCESTNRFLRSWYAHNSKCLDEDNMKSEKSLGEWLAEWKKQPRP